MTSRGSSPSHVRSRVEDGDGFDAKGRIVARTWSPETLRREIKTWPLLETDSERIQAIRRLDDTYAEEVLETENIAVDGLLAFIARGLDPTSTESAQASHLAVGTATDEPQATNTELGNEVYRSRVGDADRDGSDLLTSTFLSQAEANGYTLTEVGLVGGPVGSDEPLLTHALFDSGQEIEKTVGKAATIDYVLEIRRPA